jgi:hypothetical protein
MLYFSYGSNMSSKRLRARTPSARFITTATLYSHQLRFHKRSHDGSSKCDAYDTGNNQDYVVGVVFEIAEAEKPILDGYEGLGHGYEIKVIEIEAENGDRFEAYTYYANDIDSTLKPYHWYHQHVVSGAYEHRLPTDYIAVIESITSVNDPDNDRHAREMSIYAENIRVNR